ncbi:MAG: hypothetical protein LUH51_00405 [Firmicutes bacterium]|nr:hypothetical protein [Bacillota bacterium]
MFLVGAWNDAIEAASRIRAALREYTCGALTISGGVGVFQAKFPIRVAAAETARLEDKAKGLEHPEKDGIALFGAETEHCYHWDVFLQSVQGEKLGLLESFFGGEDADRGSSMLYNILDLLRQAQADTSRMPLARYAYLLSRLAPPNSAPDKKKKAYKAFSEKMYQWGWRRRSADSCSPPSSSMCTCTEKRDQQQKGEPSNVME